MRKKRTPPGATGEAPKKDTSQNPYGASPPDNQGKIPSKAVLARRWPRLRVNRLNWKWRDDASGALACAILTHAAFAAFVAAIDPGATLFILGRAI